MGIKSSFSHVISRAKEIPFIEKLLTLSFKSTQILDNKGSRTKTNCLTRVLQTVFNFAVSSIDVPKIILLQGEKVKT